MSALDAFYRRLLTSSDSDTVEATDTAQMYLYRVEVAYGPDGTTEWDTYSAFTVQAHSEDEALKLCRVKIGEFHAPLTLRVAESTPMSLVPRIVATEPIER